MQSENTLAADFFAYRQRAYNVRATHVALFPSHAARAVDETQSHTSNTSMKTASPAATEQTVMEKAASLGRILTPDQARGLATYLGLLETWNKKINLVGPKRWPEMLSILVADSWHLADFLDALGAEADIRNTLSLDLGAGAGIPGVPLRLFWPHGEYVLVEPRTKRAVFLELAVSSLKLAQTRVFRGRTEQLFKTILAHDKRAGLCLSRAFMPWPDFLRLSCEFLAPGGVAVVMTNEAVTQECAPDTVRLLRTSQYEAVGNTRYVSAFMPVSVPR
ncbi:16S rRNA (guanine(527)-N(7))-methyltransferase RsmG [Desulfovibrio inopinatus]|uniref:16S rRNA (guanine(527)-N(7))-methyltransferase RsmG n=1 Tax=Desulfovibrio inopinatus TaxID=102109 RepID=UPI000687DD92|nr:RsmG family class I SAM-dependent methyltransferase [Desulfovibrio inopinatus]